MNSLQEAIRLIQDALDREPDKDERRTEDQERFYLGGRHDGLCEALAILDEVRRNVR